jgi:hypothetical protein
MLIRRDHEESQSGETIKKLTGETIRKVRRDQEESWSGETMNKGRRDDEEC